MFGINFLIVLLAGERQNQTQSTSSLPNTILLTIFEAVMLMLKFKRQYIHIFLPAFFQLGKLPGFKC
jgi:hypothetical protein